MARPCTHRLLSAWASWTPFHEVALKDLSESLPTSVTRPTFQVFEQPPPPPPPPAVPPEPPQATAMTPAASKAATCRKAFMVSLPMDCQRPLAAGAGVSLA